MIAFHNAGEIARPSELPEFDLVREDAIERS